MERWRRIGGDGGNRGFEENTMAMLDTFGFNNSKISHHLDDDRECINPNIRLLTFILARIFWFCFDRLLCFRACFS